MSVVVCRLEHGLIVEIPPPVGATDARPTVLRLYCGANENVPGDLFADWLRRNAHLPVVKHRDVFLVSDAVSDRLVRDAGCAQRRKRKRPVVRMEHGDSHQ